MVTEKPKFNFGEKLMYLKHNTKVILVENILKKEGKFFYRFQGEDYLESDLAPYVPLVLTELEEKTLYAPVTSSKSPSGTVVYHFNGMYETAEQASSSEIRSPYGYEFPIGVAEIKVKIRKEN